MRLWLMCIFCTFLFTIAANAQTECPVDKVCISPQAARTALENADLVKAQADEIMTLREAVIKQKEVTIDVKIELAKAIGELTGAKQEVIRVQANLEFILLHGRNKCGGFTLLCIQK